MEDGVWQVDRTYKHGRSSTLEWCSEFSWDGIGNLEDVIRLPYSVVRERTLVEVMVSIHCSFWAQSLVASKTVFAVVARVVLVSPPD